MKNFNGALRGMVGVDPSRVYSSDLDGGSKTGQLILNEPTKAGGDTVLMGYSCFSSMAHCERVPYSRQEPFHDFEFGLFENYVEFDESWRPVVHGEADGRLLSPSNRPCIERASSRLLSDGMDKREYMEAVRAAKEYIRMGDVFQVVLARIIRLEAEGSLADVFCTMVDINPSPYMYYLKFGDKRIFGTSPETLYRVKGRRIETYPIAGTKPITGNKVLDSEAEKQLRRSVKDAAEHVMLVDLARNDLGKVCEIGTVKVPEYRRVTRFSHVQHLTSKVTGTLREHVSPSQVYSAVFPAGTVSGAPKIRAVEIIHELEKAPRGPYAGAVGYVTSNGDADFAINIRSAHSYGETVFVGAGAGIVADSDPAAEFTETEHKSASCLTALGVPVLGLA
ncbi:MAG: anthranilate synthase component I family protein [Thermoprotei archaeon]